MKKLLILLPLFLLTLTGCVTNKPINLSSTDRVAVIVNVSEDFKRRTLRDCDKCTNHPTDWNINEFIKTNISSKLTEYGKKVTVFIEDQSELPIRYTRSELNKAAYFDNSALTEWGKSNNFQYVLTVTDGQICYNEYCGPTFTGFGFAKVEMAQTSRFGAGLNYFLVNTAQAEYYIDHDIMTYLKMPHIYIKVDERFPEFKEATYCVIDKNVNYGLVDLKITPTIFNLPASVKPYSSPQQSRRGFAVEECRNKSPI